MGSIRLVILVLFCIFLFFIACGKDSPTESSIEVPKLTTTAVSEITDQTAKCGGTITSNGGAEVTKRGVCWSTNQTPTLSDNKTEDGSGSGGFVSSLENLEPNTSYFIRAYATNSAGTGFGDTVSFKTEEPPIIVTDIDGNTYQAIKIGNQVWMAENLRVTHYRNGDPIPHVADDNQWKNLATGAFCDVENDTTNRATYGLLYNWNAIVDSRNIAPVGWHVPSNEEWQVLIDYLGGNATAGGKMKESGTSHWRAPNTGATNESGLTALPAGYRGLDGDFFNLEYSADFATTTENDNSSFRTQRLSYENERISSRVVMKTYGFSVRCIKD
jgi:uncharacterized protein (TIGR02145 family)